MSFFCPISKLLASVDDDDEEEDEEGVAKASRCSLLLPPLRFLLFSRISLLPTEEIMEMTKKHSMKTKKRKTTTRQWW